MTQILDGKGLSKTIKLEIADQVKARVTGGGKRPHLAAILVGADGASETYVGHKVKACEQVGFESTILRFDTEISEEDLLNEIHGLNNNPEIDGFIVQLPLPKHISVDKVTEAVDPLKDVDGFHPTNVGKMVKGKPCLLPATPMGIMTMLERYNVETSGKHAVVIGRSDIVGKPMSILLSRNANPGNCTVSLCHSRTKNLKEFTLNADILVVALGVADFVTGDMVKEGATVIDVGITRVKSNVTKSGWKLKGDVDYESVAPKCSYITPVPGGVGPMTICSLLQNTLTASEKTL